MIQLRLDDLIRQRGMSQRYVAKQVGVNENTLRNWIQGRSFPRLDQAVKLAKVFDVDIKQLYKDC